MNNVFKKSYIGNICDINLSTYSLSENWKFVNYLDTGNITKNKIENIQYIDLNIDKLPSRARRKVKQNNIIYSTVRPNQMHYGIIKRKLLENFLVSTGFAVLDVDSTQAEPYFVYYSLIQDDNTTALQAIAEQSTSAYPSIKPSDIKNREILLPPLETQQKIAKVLSAIDDKIELNNSINNNLEQQAQAIFKSWFVDFEPFGGTMPDNWKSLTLGDVTENIRTRIGKNNYIVLSAVNTGKLQPSDEFFSKQVYSKNTEKYIKVDEGNFAYNPARINIGSIGINDLGYTGCVSPVYVAFSVEHHYESFFRFYFKSSIFKEETRTRASGSVRQSLNYTDFALIEINYPSTDIARKFNEIYNTFFKVKNDIEKENKSLIQLRDTLLPKLMSGEIDVSKVEIDDILTNQSADKLLFREDK